MPWRFAAMLGYIACYLTWIGALAMLLSVLAGDNAVISVVGTVAITLISHLFGGLSTLARTRGFLPTRNFDSWVDFTNADFDPIRVEWGAFLSLVYAAIFSLLAYGFFAGRDVRTG
jgi:ABC-2 type transport system permease protein